MSAYGYRRGSIFWALTLIGVGGLFLYQNFNPAVHPWEIIAKFWPVVIIFWGLSKLIDHLQARAHPETTPPPLFSASEVVLLILVLAMGTLVSHVVLNHWGWWNSNIQMGDNEDWESIFQNSYDYTQTLNLPVQGQPHLVFVDHHGDVELRKGNPGSVQAVVKEVIHADNEDQAKRLSDQLKFEIVPQNGQYVLQSNLDSLSGGSGQVRLDITLSVPPSTSSDLTVEHGDLVLSGLQGDQNVADSHGDAHISDVEGLVRLKKSGGSTEVRGIKGSVEVEGRGDDVQIADIAGAATVNGEFSGDIEFSNISQTLRYLSSRTDLTLQKLTGRLTMDTGSLEASGVDGPFDLSTRAKDISLDGFSHSVKIADTTGDIELRAAVNPSHPIEVESSKGEIQLTLPSSSSFQIDATSQHGEVESDFSGPSLKVNNSGEAPSISGLYGKGGPTIHLSTAYGTIHLGQGEAGTPSPAPTPSSRT